MFFCPLSCNFLTLVRNNILAWFSNIANSFTVIPLSNSLFLVPYLLVFLKVQILIFFSPHTMYSPGGCLIFLPGFHPRPPNYVCSPDCSVELQTCIPNYPETSQLGFNEAHGLYSVTSLVFLILVNDYDILVPKLDLGNSLCISLFPLWNWSESSIVAT